MAVTCSNVSSEWTWPETSTPPGAQLCVTSVQVEVWFQGCRPTCWQAGGAPVRGGPVSPLTRLPPTPPLRRSWRKTTTAMPSTLDSTNTCMAILGATVSHTQAHRGSGRRRVQLHGSVGRKAAGLLTCRHEATAFHTALRFTEQ